MANNILKIQQNDVTLEVAKSDNEELHFSFYYTDSNSQIDSEDFFLTKDQLLNLLQNG